MTKFFSRVLLLLIGFLIVANVALLMLWLLRPWLTTQAIDYFETQRDSLAASLYHETGLQWHFDLKGIDWHRLNPEVHFARVAACYQSQTVSDSDGDEHSSEKLPDADPHCSLQIVEATVTLDLLGMLFTRSTSFNAISADKLDVTILRSIEGLKLAGLRQIESESSAGGFNLDALKAVRIGELVISTVYDESKFVSRRSWVPHKLSYLRSGARGLLQATPLQASAESVRLKMRKSASRNPHASLVQGWSGLLSVKFSSDSAETADELLTAYDRLHVIFSPSNDETLIDALLYAEGVEPALNSPLAWPPLHLSGHANLAPALRYFDRAGLPDFADWLHLDWQPIAPAGANVAIEAGSLSMGVSPAGPALALSQRAIGVEALIKQVDLIFRPDKQFVDFMDRLAPAGALDYFKVNIPLAKPEEFRISGQLNGVSVDSVNPRAINAKNVSGRFALNRRGGVLSLEKDALPTGVTFPATYRDTLWFYPEQADLKWIFDDERFYIGGSELQLRYQSNAGVAAEPQAQEFDELHLHGRFLANVRRDRRFKPSELDLELAVANQTQVKPLLDFVPDAAPASLKRWLDNSNLSGEASDVGFLYRGSLGRRPGAERRYALRAQLEGVSLEYLEEWPEVKNLAGQFLLVDGAVRTDVAAASIGTASAGASLSLANSALEIVNEAGVSRLSLEGHVEDSLQDLFSFLDATPIRSVVPEQVALANARARINTRFKLSLPISGAGASGADETEDSDTWDTVDLRLNGNLEAGGFDAIPGFRVSEVSGELEFDAGKGFVGTRLRGRLLESDVAFSVIDPSPVDSIERSGQNWRGHTKIEARGGFVASALFKALEVPVELPVDGETRANGVIEFAGGRASVKLTSGLEGIDFSLPEPFLKRRNDSLNLSLQWFSESDQQTLAMGLGNWLSLSTNRYQALTDAQFTANFFPDSPGSTNAGLRSYKPFSVLDSILAEPPESILGKMVPRLTLTGFVPVFDWAAWQETVSALSNDQEQIASSAFDGFLVDGLKLGEILLGDSALPTSSVSLFASAESLYFDLQNDQLNGAVALPFGLLSSLPFCSGESDVVQSSDAGRVDAMPALPDLSNERPRIAIALNYLKLEAPELTTDTGSGLFDQYLQPGCLPDANVDVLAMSLGQRDYGSWRFLHTAGEDIGLIHAVDGRIDATSISSSAEEGLLWAKDRNNDISTSLSVEVFSTGIDKVLVDNVAVAQSPLFADNSYVGASLHWPGAPHKFAMATMTGDMKFELKDGRFVEVPTVASGFLKIVSVVNVQRYLSKLDFSFSDIVSEGVGFDSLKGRLDFDAGEVSFRDKPIIMRASSSDFQMQGVVDLQESTIDAELVATLPLGSNLPWVAALAGGLPVAAGTFIATRAFDKEFDRLSSVVYEVKGKIEDPEVSLKQVFDDGKSSGAKGPESARLKKHKRR